MKRKRDCRNLSLWKYAQVFFACILLFVVVMGGKKHWDSQKQNQQTNKLIQEKKEEQTSAPSTLAGIKFDHSIAKPEILNEYQTLFQKNSDLIGWLTIPDTNINYPVMQTKEDEDYYLSYDFEKNKNKNGCLILDSDSNAGVGKKDQDYQKGSKPSTNLIIHGHTMKSGEMFGKLSLYEKKEYGTSHKFICFDSLYEKRTYEVISVFYSQVFYQNQDVFKYYKFFQADSESEFGDWYTNIKTMSLYDTGVTAEWGDEFITLSCCSYQTEDGRFVVIGKRINSNLESR